MPGIFINHPRVGTIRMQKSIPHYRSKRHKLMDAFFRSVSIYTGE